MTDNEIIERITEIEKEKFALQKKLANKNIPCNELGILHDWKGSGFLGLFNPLVCSRCGRILWEA